MQIGISKKFLKVASVIGLILLFGVFNIYTVNADTNIDTNFHGSIINSQVGRSNKEKISNLPVESYFGQPQYLTWQDQLKALNITVYPEDSVSTFPDASLGIGDVIRVTRATPVTIKDGSSNLIVRTWAQTIGELLSEQKIELAQDDTVDSGLSSSILPNEVIIITRVEVSQVVEESSIDFNITKKNDATLDQGKTKISQPGKNGLRTKVYQVRRENQVEVSRDLLNDNVTTKPINEILLIGTKPVITVRCKYNSTVIDAANKYNLNANDLCHRMMAESNGHPNSDGGRYKGLFQYEGGLWSSVSAKAGYAGASIWDAEAQIYTTAWAWSHGYRGRWPS